MVVDDDLRCQKELSSLSLLEEHAVTMSWMTLAVGTDEALSFNLDRPNSLL
jgi:hypothetical protein